MTKPKLSQLAQSGATVGQFARWNGTIWVPATAPGNIETIKEVSDGSSDTISVDVTGFSGGGAVGLVSFIRSQRAAATSSGTNVRYNSDSGANYNSHRERFLSDGSQLTQASTADTRMFGPEVPATTSPANRFGSGHFLVGDYRGSSHKTFEGHYTAAFADTAGGNTQALCSSTWKDTAVVTSIQFVDTTGADLVSGSYVIAYLIPE